MIPPDLDTLTRANAVADQHPGEVGVVGETVNRYGTPVSVLRCSKCGHVVTICPVVTDPESWGDGCLAESCESYDPTRDIDIYWLALADHHMIRLDQR